MSEDKTKEQIQLVRDELRLSVAQVRAAIDLVIRNSRRVVEENDVPERIATAVVSGELVSLTEFLLNRFTDEEGSDYIIKVMLEGLQEEYPEVYGE